MNLTDLSQVVKLNSVYIFILWGRWFVNVANLMISRYFDWRWNSRGIPLFWNAVLDVDVDVDYGKPETKI